MKKNRMEKMKMMRKWLIVSKTSRNTSLSCKEERINSRNLARSIPRNSEERKMKIYATNVANLIIMPKIVKLTTKAIMTRRKRRRMKCF